METAELWQIVFHFDRHLGIFVAQHGNAVYAMLFAIIFCEIGLLPLFFLPGDRVIFVCGAYSAPGALAWQVVVPLLCVAAFGGSLLSYGVGSRLRRTLDARHPRWLNQDALHRSQRFYQRYGATAFLFSPYIAVVRTFCPFVAGIAAMDFARFSGVAALGAIVWIGGLVTAGYWFGNLPLIRDNMNAIVLSGVALGVGALLLGALWRRLRANNPR